jgi:tetratricopeptide (TPR) repeat protein
MAKYNLGDFFGPPRSSDPLGDMEQQLAELERQAAEAVPGFGAHFLNRAGDLCVDVGRVDRGLSYLGRAIDMYLQAGRWDAAAAVCRKLLRVSPYAVRAHCTLAWLAIGKGHSGDARQEIRDYIDAAQAAGPAEVQMTRKQVKRMADAVFDPAVLEALAEELWQLSDHEGARAVGLRMKRMLDEGVVVSRLQRERTWTAVLRSALMGPRELADLPGGEEDGSSA